MRATPPHLLLTNYAMLEYLLLRPRDMDLFDGEASRQLAVHRRRRGARLRRSQGRRARDAAAPAARPGRTGARTCSASPPARRWAPTATRRPSPSSPANLFGVPFEWVQGDPIRQDLVTATRVAIPDGPAWGPLPAAAYARARRGDGPGRAAVAAAAERTAGPVPATAPTRCAAKPASQGSELRWHRDLGHSTPSPRRCSRRAMPRRRERQLTDLVRLGATVRSSDRSPVLSARFHLFVRATEGAFSCLGRGEPHLSAQSARAVRAVRRGRVRAGRLPPLRRCAPARRARPIVVRAQAHPVPGGRRQASTPGCCWRTRRRGSPSRTRTTPRSKTSRPPTGRGTSCAPAAARSSTRPPPRVAIRSASGAGLRPVRLLDSTSASLGYCAGCGARGPALIRLLESGGEAAASVLGTSLYQALPPDLDRSRADRPGRGRKLLFFSDSRQMAAYFAPYLRGHPPTDLASTHADDGAPGLAHRGRGRAGNAR